MAMISEPLSAEEKLAYAAEDFIRAAGLEPTQDALDQLTGPFREALAVMCTRGYSPDGATWRIRGWKGLVHDILDNAFRIRFHSWRNNRFYANGAIDIINFAGFYWRTKAEGPAWGELGEPG